jgi:uncharacterized membrane protein
MAIAPKNISQLLRISVVLKGLHALIEVIGGVLLYFLTPQAITHLIHRLTQNGIHNDRRDLIADHLLQFARHFSISARTFAAFYLLSHGVIKLFLVIELLRNRLWAYPASLAVLGVFIVYQLYRYTHTHSIALMVFTLFDLIVIWLIWREYKIVRQQNRG